MTVKDHPDDPQVRSQTPTLISGQGISISNIDGRRGTTDSEDAIPEGGPLKRPIPSPISSRDRLPPRSVVSLQQSLLYANGSAKRGHFPSIQALGVGTSSCINEPFTHQPGQFLPNHFLRNTLAVVASTLQVHNNTEQPPEPPAPGARQASPVLKKWRIAGMMYIHYYLIYTTTFFFLSLSLSFPSSDDGLHP